MTLPGIFTKLSGLGCDIGRSLRRSGGLRLSGFGRSSELDTAIVFQQ
jgi:hypothetical protein